MSPERFPVRPPGEHRRLPLLWIDVISPYPAVARGLKDILETTLGSKVFTTLGPVDGEPDVILYDVIGLSRATGPIWISGSSGRERWSSR